MSFLFRTGRCPVEDRAVKALFAENLEAHDRASRAAEEVTKASDDSRAKLEDARAEMKNRSWHQQHARPEPHTSDVRRLAEAALARVQPRSDRKG